MRLAVLFLAWFAVGLWNPTVGGITFAIGLGVLGVRMVYRRFA